MAAPKPNKTPARAIPRQALARIQNDDLDFQLGQDNTQKAIQSLQGTPFSAGTLLQTTSVSGGDKQNSTVLTLTAGQDNVFQHNLGRIPKFVLPFVPSANAVIWQTASDKTNITLRCSANCSVTVWVS